MLTKGQAFIEWYINSVVYWFVFLRNSAKDAQIKSMVTA